MAGWLVDLCGDQGVMEGSGGVGGVGLLAKVEPVQLEGRKVHKGLAVCSPS
jgi:hypothetical protein